MPIALETPAVTPVTTLTAPLATAFIAYYFFYPSHSAASPDSCLDLLLYASHSSPLLSSESNYSPVLSFRISTKCLYASIMTVPFTSSSSSLDYVSPVLSRFFSPYFLIIESIVLSSNSPTYTLIVKNINDYLSI
jgi:hypothetical protein